MCILDFKAFSELISLNNFYQTKQFREFQEWSYDDQEAWKSYQDYYSTIRTPFDIKTNFVVCEKKMKEITINYTDNTSGLYANDHQTPFFLPNNTDNYILYDDKKFVLQNYHLHCSSEHSVNELYFPVECHFVNSYTDEATNQKFFIVIGLLVNLSNTHGLSIFNINYEQIKDDGNRYESTANLAIFNNLPLNPY